MHRELLPNRRRRKGRICGFLRFKRLEPRRERQHPLDEMSHAHGQLPLSALFPQHGDTHERPEELGQVDGLPLIVRAFQVPNIRNCALAHEESIDLVQVEPRRRQRATLADGPEFEKRHFRRLTRIDGHRRVAAENILEGLEIMPEDALDLTHPGRRIGHFTHLVLRHLLPRAVEDVEEPVLRGRRRGLTHLPLLE